MPRFFALPISTLTALDRLNIIESRKKNKDERKNASLAHFAHIFDSLTNDVKCPLKN